MNAPRALPTWSGPVGLAETNSTLTERPVPSAAVRPQLDGSARIAATVASSASSRSRRLRKPGAATSAAAIGLAGSSRGLRRSAPRRAPRRWRAAPSGTAGRASSPGCSRSRRAPDRPGVRPRRPADRRRPASPAAPRSPPSGPRRARPRRERSRGSSRRGSGSSVGSRGTRTSILVRGAGWSADGNGPARLGPADGRCPASPKPPEVPHDPGPKVPSAKCPARSGDDARATPGTRGDYIARVHHAGARSHTRSRSKPCRIRPDPAAAARAAGIRARPRPRLPWLGQPEQLGQGCRHLRCPEPECVGVGHAQREDDRVSAAGHRGRRCHQLRHAVADPESDVPERARHRRPGQGRRHLPVPPDHADPELRPRQRPGRVRFLGVPDPVRRHQRHPGPDRHPDRDAEPDTQPVAVAIAVAHTDAGTDGRADTDTEPVPNGITDARPQTRTASCRTSSAPARSLPTKPGVRPDKAPASCSTLIFNPQVGNKNDYTIGHQSQTAGSSLPCATTVMTVSP